MTNENYASLDEQSKNTASVIVNSINEGIVNGFENEVAVGGYVTKIVDIIKGNPEVTDALASLLSLDVTDLPVNEAKTLIDLYIKSIAETLGENEFELKVMLGVESTDDIVRKLKTSIRTITAEHGKTNREDYTALIQYTKEFNQEQTMAWLEATRGAENATRAIEMYENKLAKQNKEQELDTSAPVTLSSSLKESQEFIDKFQTSVKSASDAYATLLADNYSSQFIDSPMSEAA